MLKWTWLKAAAPQVPTNLTISGFLKQLFINLKIDIFGPESSSPSNHLICKNNTKFWFVRDWFFRFFNIAQIDFFKFSSNGKITKICCSEERGIITKLISGFIFSIENGILIFLVRVASSNKDSLSMEYQRRRLGSYKAIGSMNDKLVRLNHFQISINNYHNCLWRAYEQF